MSAREETICAVATPPGARGLGIVEKNYLALVVGDWQFGEQVLIERFVPGRELTVGVLGNERPTTFPVWEMSFGRWPAGRPRTGRRRLWRVLPAKGG